MTMLASMLAMLAAIPRVWLIRGMISVSALGAFAWLADVIGDRREARVKAEYAAAITAANHRADEAHAHWSAHYQQQFAQRLGTLADIKAGVDGLAAQPAPVQACPAPAPARPPVVALSPDLLRRLNAVRPSPRGK